MDLPIENLAISEEGPPVEKTAFLSLPDDVLTRIIEKELSAADRKNLDFNVVCSHLSRTTQWHYEDNEQ
ncbi:hypothetical protein PRIPAC_89027 [Pristionchus pacificus]|uniref:Uncharacterized protein n=1 Tax=Pristionchus pacificus TaxID=54126 RepID=A0A2A6B983_PRIPA|nr:hypothetical protein PRIPAC_89027 [Pristionchus pacificus]|eukprot:PDM62435.1 hypothetical protein PRIPAC_51877 [Pristionchus pacificus]